MMWQGFNQNRFHETQNVTIIHGLTLSLSPPSNTKCHFSRTDPFTFTFIIHGLTPLYESLSEHFGISGTEDHLEGGLLSHQ